MDQEM